MTRSPTASRSWLPLFLLSLLLLPSTLARSGQSQSRRSLRGRQVRCKARQYAEVPADVQLPVQANVNETEPSVEPSAAAASDSRKAWCSSAAPLLDTEMIQKVKSNLAARGTDSWVSGIRMQAYLELDSPKLSVFNPGYYAIADKGSVVNEEVNGIAKYWLDLLSPQAPNMVDDGEAAGDTAAPGVAFMNAAKTGPSTDRKKYTTYANRNVDWLLTEVPRMSNGAISHRPVKEAAQLWNDFNYFVPPYFAYWGVLNKNLTVAREGYNQIKYYRELLRDPATDLWRHTTNNGEWEDSYRWGTGMGYTAGGMIRTYVTLKYSPFASQLEKELADLAAWANEIVAATFQRVSSSSGLLPISYNPHPNNFDDAGHTAFLASVAYRMSDLGLLEEEDKHIRIAEELRKKVYDTLNKETGWLPAARRYELRQEHPQALGFLLLMEAAARDYGSSCKV